MKIRMMPEKGWHAEIQKMSKFVSFSLPRICGWGYCSFPFMAINVSKPHSGYCIMYATAFSYPDS